MFGLRALLSGFLVMWICCSAAPVGAQALRLGSTGAAAGVLQRLVDGFPAAEKGLKVEIIAGLGGAGSIAAVAAGALDLAIASRDLNEKERAQGAVNILLFETPYVFVSASSAPLSLSYGDIAQIYTGERRSYPNGEPLRLILRPRGDANSLFLAGIPGIGEALEQARQRHDLPVAGTDQDNMEQLNRIEGAFSSMTLTQLMTTPNTLQRVSINGVAPSVEALTKGTYPLRMRLYIVTRKVPGEGARAFIAHIASPAGRAVIEAAGGRMLMP